METPLVSIITPVYNSLPYLHLTAKSVLDQTYSEWEWCITDDCSNDGSWDAIKKLAISDSRIKPLRLRKNVGSGAARNNAIKRATGRYIAFLDSDDVWSVEKLERHIAFMKANNAVFSHTSYGYIDEAGRKIKSTFRVSSYPVTYQHLLKRTEISCLTAIYDANAIGKYYMSEHRRKQDYALWLAILKSGVKSIPLDEELAFYRQRKGSATSNKWALISKHIDFLRATQGFTYFQALYYTSFWLVNGVIRYYIR
jgi:teichuronic acid biosynthesis glycosyltransferase TuaG